jgi:hypothetical protein
VPEKVPPGTLVQRQEAGQRLRPLESVAGVACGYYVAAGVVATLYTRLHVIHAQGVDRVDLPAVDAPPLVAREDFRPFHRAPHPVNIPDKSRRVLFDRLKRFIDADEAIQTPQDLPPRLTFSALEALRMSRSRDRILTNLEEMYREAFDRAKTTEDPSQMAALDFSYRREQLYFEILLDIRDAMERR